MRTVRKMIGENVLHNRTQSCKVRFIVSKICNSAAIPIYCQVIARSVNDVPAHRSVVLRHAGVAI
jgi:hypothetical protein